MHHIECKSVLVEVEMDRSLPVGTGLFGLAVSVWPIRSEPFRPGLFGHGHFGQTIKSCRNLTLMQSLAVWFKAHSLHHHTVGCQQSRHSTQSVLRLRFAVAASAVCKVFYSA